MPRLPGGHAGRGHGPQQLCLQVCGEEPPPRITLLFLRERPEALLLPLHQGWPASLAVTVVRAGALEPPTPGAPALRPLQLSTPVAPTQPRGKPEHLSGASKPCEVCPLRPTWTMPTPPSPRTFPHSSTHHPSLSPAGLSPVPHSHGQLFVITHCSAKWPSRRPAPAHDLNDCLPHITSEAEFVLFTCCWFPVSIPTRNVGSFREGHIILHTGVFPGPGTVPGIQQGINTCCKYGHSHAGSP